MDVLAVGCAKDGIPTVVPVSLAVVVLLEYDLEANPECYQESILITIAAVVEDVEGEGGIRIIVTHESCSPRKCAAVFVSIFSHHDR